MDTLAVCVAGATGWTGRAVAQGALRSPDVRLRSAVSRRAAGGDLGESWGGARVDVPVFAQVADALDGVDVLIDYTAPDAVLDNVLAAVERGVHVVVGTSGLSAEQYARIDERARERGVGVIASGNFSITAALLQAAALLAARHLPQWEIVDYAGAGKPDAPSGTARELAERLGEVRTPTPAIDTVGVAGARGAEIGGAQTHSVRLPGYTLAVEAIFGLPGERLSLRHEAGESAEPYVAGTLMAARLAPGRVGVTRGLDTLLLEP
ncbi:4-hydroxy-tetrahydrodipicolinate reductase [Actinomycetospora atypica]|uniref:4-hydroxy-tetrahydrodipicolinate reductase n=1 Tax=Actinomycetospora atypica TaxID=1290095 RepID=A0ABV9YTL5_9PSEU